MTAFTVRRATAEDLAAIRRFVEEAHDAQQPWASSWSLNQLDDELRQAEVQAAVSPAGVFAGFLCMRPPGSAFEITLIAVVPAFRGQGVGGLLIERTAKSGPISLEVRSDNVSAIRAYEKAGFLPVGKRRAYYRDGCDAILYTKA